MKINPKILAAFVGYLKKSGHGIKERGGCLVFTRNKKEVIINSDDEINQHGYRLYMTFMYQWLEKGKDFIDKMRGIGAMMISRLIGKNYKECEK